MTIRRGSGVPLVLGNGIGAGREVLDPLVAVMGWRTGPAIRVPEPTPVPQADTRVDRNMKLIGYPGQHRGRHGAWPARGPGENAHPRRFLDHEYAAAIAGDLYGGTVRTDPSNVKRLLDRQLMAGSRIGYLHQLLATSVWTPSSRCR